MFHPGTRQQNQQGVADPHLYQKTRILLDESTSLSQIKHLYPSLVLARSSSKTRSPTEFGFFRRCLDRFRGSDRLIVPGLPSCARTSMWKVTSMCLPTTPGRLTNISDCEKLNCHLSIITFNLLCQMNSYKLMYLMY